VAEMKYPHFLLSIVCGRLLRFLILAGLTIKFGPEVVSLLGGLFKHHGKAILLVLAAMALVGLIWWLIKRNRRGPKEAVQTTL
jgi:membrane protein DedA with SNARE-associated domain